MDPGSTKAGRFGPALYLVLLLVALTSTVSGQNASAACSYTFSQNKEYATCVALSQLNCYLHWSYNASTGIADIAFRATNVKAATAGNWVAWALNPTSNGMAGAQALVAFKNSSGLMSAYTSSVASTDTSTKLTESALSFAVAELAAESSGGTQIIIFAKIQVPQNKTSVNHVWQVGPLSGDSPEQHPQTTDHVTSKGTVDFLSGVAQAGGGGGSRIRNKNNHGVLNAVSWGLMMPLGFIIARYMRVFKSADPAWFYLHITCQSSAYVIGVAGWGLGLKLGHDSTGVTYHTHRYIGIALFCLATLQVLALLLRPNKDHKYRIYWNFYHHGIGYTVIILSIINVFKGLDILDPEKKWKTIYIILLIVLGCIALLLEVITWIVVIRRKRKDGPEQKYPYVAQNARSGSNGLRSQP